jgi:histidinol dehydrogenase
MQRIDTQSSDFEAQIKEVVFPAHSTDVDLKIQTKVSNIITKIRQDGDAALIEFTKRFDNNGVGSASELKIAPHKITHSLELIDAQSIADLQLAIERISRFHQKQLVQDWFYTDEQGVLLGQRVLPIESVGVYVPGGKACYPSSILMNVIPAQVAGVQQISLVTPAMNGELNPIILATAALLGIENIYQIGGAQAVAALAYGTETVPGVDKITGPGNAYVAEAKRQVFGAVGIDMIAGPSEVVIIADKSANPTHLAIDLFAQAEHDELARAILISDNQEILDKTVEAIEHEITKMPRQAIIRESLKNHGAFIKTQNLDESIEISNQIAPEHLELCIDSAEEVMTKVQSAGAIFLGKHTPEAFGDYLAGSNHILPTSRSARFSSPLGVYDFQKRSNYIQANASAAQQLFPTVSRLAKVEGLHAHSLSCDLRVDSK